MRHTHSSSLWRCTGLVHENTLERAAYDVGNIAILGECSDDVLRYTEGSFGALAKRGFNAIVLHLCVPCRSARFMGRWASIFESQRSNISEHRCVPIYGAATRSHSNPLCELCHDLL